MWNERYQTKEYVYGTSPNEFLASTIENLKCEGELLSLGEGEGRNAIFLAKCGFKVTALDLSDVGLEKARKLAKGANVEIQTITADLSNYTIPEKSYDVIVSIFCHLPAQLQRKVNADVVKALKPGGLLILEGFSKDQLSFTSGGPRSQELLMQLDTLEKELDGLQFHIARQVERELSEGPLHRGRCSVIQVLAYKNLL